LEKNMEIRHLCREVKTALELAIAGLVPAELVDRLAMSAGLLDALSEFPLDSAHVSRLLPRTLTGARQALEDWQAWQEKHLVKASA
jgi:hypothetical protein